MLHKSVERFWEQEHCVEYRSALYQGFKAQIDAYLAADPSFARKISQRKINPNKPGKTRLVNDAMGEFKGKRALMIPDRTDPATKLLIDWTHRRNGHVDHVLAIIQELYWILCGRININQMVHNCFFCPVVWQSISISLI